MTLDEKLDAMATQLANDEFYTHDGNVKRDVDILRAALSAACQLQRAEDAAVCREMASVDRKVADNLDAEGHHGAAEVFAERAHLALGMAAAIEAGGERKP